MARRPGGCGARRVVPGVRAALIARNRRFDRSLHMEFRACGWCARIAALEAGEPLLVTGDTIASAVFDERHPRDFEDLRGDKSFYAVVGPDTIEAVDADTL